MNLECLYHFNAKVCLRSAGNESRGNIVAVKFSASGGEPEYTVRRYDGVAYDAAESELLSY
jgi:hypothetical protein